MFISYFGYISYQCSYHLVHNMSITSRAQQNIKAVSSYQNGTAVQILKEKIQTPASMTLVQQYCSRTRLLILLITLVLEEIMKVVEWISLMVS